MGGARRAAPAGSTAHDGSGSGAGPAEEACDGSAQGTVHGHVRLPGPDAHPPSPAKCPNPHCQSTPEGSVCPVTGCRSVRPAPDPGQQETQAVGELRKETASLGGRPGGGRAGRIVAPAPPGPPAPTVPGGAVRETQAQAGARGSLASRRITRPPRPAPPPPRRPRPGDGWTDGQDGQTETAGRGGCAGPPRPPKPAWVPARKWAWFHNPEVGRPPHSLFRALGRASPARFRATSWQERVRSGAPDGCSPIYPQLLRPDDPPAEDPRALGAPRPEGGVHPGRTLLAPSAPSLRPKYTAARSARGRGLALHSSRSGDGGAWRRDCHPASRPGSPGRGSCPHGAWG